MPHALLIIAEAATQPGTQSTARPPQGSLFDMLPFLLIMMFIFYFMLIRPQSKEKKRRTEMLSALKKNDRVVTAGGIFGTITSVRDDEITLKVDESSNTKITFSRQAIQRVANPVSSADEK